MQVLHLTIHLGDWLARRRAPGLLDFVHGVQVSHLPGLRTLLIGSVRELRGEIEVRILVVVYNSHGVLLLDLNDVLEVLLGFDSLSILYHLPNGMLIILISNRIASLLYWRLLVVLTCLSEHLAVL